MLSEEWLASLNFEMTGGANVTGLLGIGSSKVVLAATWHDGKEVAVRTSRNQIGFHIQEIPPDLTVKKEYDVDVVNEKLLKLVGDSRFDTYSYWYDLLYARLVKIISEHGLGGVIMSNQAPDSVDSIPFILSTMPMHRRLDEIAYWPVDPDDPLTQMPIVNGEEYGVITYVLDGIIPWAKKALDALDNNLGYGQHALPKKMLDNPLVIWGAAAMEGFFDDEELEQVGRFIKARFGELVGREDAHALISQVDMIANLCVQYHSRCPVDRMVKLCAKCGFFFQARDIKGTIVADGTALFR